MAIVNFREVYAGYGGSFLLEGVDLSIERGERLCLLGRNGTGKSTLLKLITGDLEPISGTIEFQRNLKVAALLQQVPTVSAGSIYDVVADGLGEQGRLLREYFDISHKVAEDPSDDMIEKLSSLSAEIESTGGWLLETKIETVLSMMNLRSADEFASLSAGVKRRVMLAKAVVNEPDLLLLDEPTNHLDNSAISGLEDYLNNCGITLLFVTHDRAFLRKLSTRIIEIDRGSLLSYNCGYDEYLTRKEQNLAAEMSQQREFDKKLAEEEKWIRKGIQGRRTRNEGRVRELQQMRAKRQSRKIAPDTAKMSLQQADRSGRLVAELKNVSFAYERDKPIIENLSTTVMRGDRIGILGPNGAGKSTLLNLLLGKIKPRSGSIRLGTNLQIAYFDQLHNRLDENKTVVDNVGDGYKTLQLDGKPRNIIGYLKDFLFLPERSKTLVSSLSGGEKSRLLLAKMFAKPSNVLVLDEPTNDLDIETLELLEQMLIDYDGTVLAVSHDREFLNNVVTSMLVFENNGIKEYIGGYDDYIRAASAAAGQKVKPDKQAKKSVVKPPSKPKLSFHEKRELEALPAKIEEAEKQVARLHSKMAAADFYKSPSEQIAAAASKLTELERELEKMYDRWQHLESLDR